MKISQNSPGKEEYIYRNTHQMKRMEIMPLINCTKCGKAYFSYGGRPICPECKALEEKEFEIVREYIILL